jgi:hypothetical protein
MHLLRRFALSATVLSACTAIGSHASAATVTLSSSSINAISNGTATFIPSLLGNTICSFTLRGTLTTSIATATNTLTTIGSITGVAGGSLLPCQGGATGVSLLGFPWSVGLSTTLPSANTLRLTLSTSNFSFAVLSIFYPGGSCLDGPVNVNYTHDQTRVGNPITFSSPLGFVTSGVNAVENCSTTGSNAGYWGGINITLSPTITL